MHYLTLNINQKINAKGNDIVSFSKDATGRLMRNAKKGWIISAGTRMRLKSEDHRDDHGAMYDSFD